MQELLPVLVIVGIVALVMAKQIGKVTDRLEAQETLGDAERYAQFSAIIQEYVRSIKQSLDPSKTLDERPYQLIDTIHTEKALEMLSDMIRKLVFFETLMAKNKSNREIEADLFEILNTLELFLKEYCINGEALSETLRQNLLEAYERLGEED